VYGRVPTAWSLVGMMMILVATIWVMLKSDEKPAPKASPV
jgi:hypothetical protein